MDEKPEDELPEAVPEEEIAGEHDEELAEELEDDEIAPEEEAFVRGYTSDREDAQKE